MKCQNIFRAGARRKQRLPPQSRPLKQLVNLRTTNYPTVGYPLKDHTWDAPPVVRITINWDEQGRGAF